jgi:hypothetical protein
MDGANDDDHDVSIEQRIQIAATAGVRIFDGLLNRRLSQSGFTLTPQARGNGPAGWMFSPPRNDHIARILSQLSDSLLNAAFAHRDPRMWTSLDAAQDGIYSLGSLEHMVSL